ncbi:MAG: hypothetical protein RJA70_4739 [Pseudomonadota bacterium]|jgi:mono/diheme cytochrome c family protein
MNLAPFPALLLVTAVLLGCDSKPVDLREWTVSDHQHNSQSGATEKGQVAGEAKEVLPGIDQVALATWTAKCVLCHGKLGRGDGPQSPMFSPRDLSDPAWQTATTDAQMLSSIQQGKGKMPGFALPEKTALSLVKLVRVFNRDAAAAAAASGAAPAPTAAE